MREYKKIDKLSVWDGDVIKYIYDYYDNSIISKSWGVHFVRRVRFLRVKSITNNLTARCMDSSGKLLLLNMIDNNVVCGYTKK